MTRPVYLTARCTRGCERWGTPAEIAEHVRLRRCRGVAWFRRPVDSVYIGARDVRLLGGTAAAHLLTGASGSRGADGAGSPFHDHRTAAGSGGARLRSPIDGVAPRVWWHLVKERLEAERATDEVIAAALDPAAFAAWLADDRSPRFVECVHCGEVVVGVELHQRVSSRCRAARAANRVSELWALGYRDPWTATERPPLSWNELRTARWRHRTALVELPRSNAVLLAPR